MAEQEAKSRIGRIHSPVLSNRNPPYGLVGGLYDALRDSKGQAYAVSCRRRAPPGGCSSPWRAATWTRRRRWRWPD